MANLKERLGKEILKRKKRGVSREICVQNFNTAKTAVILFDTADSESFKAIKDFIKYLEEKQISVSTFAFVHQKEVPQELLFLKNYAFITTRDLNWYKKPSGEAVQAFYAVKPDILFDFTMDMGLGLQFLVQLSEARFKVGSFTEEQNDYDLMISLNENTQASFLAEQFKRYIAMLNPVNES